MRPRLLLAVTALARLAGAGIAAAGVLLGASGLAGSAPAAHALSPPPKPCPRAGSQIVHDLPQWSIHVDGRDLMVASEGTVLGVRDRTVAETAAIGSYAPVDLRVWGFAVDSVLAGTLAGKPRDGPVEVYSFERVQTTGVASDVKVPLTVGKRYQIVALWLPPPWRIDPASASLYAYCTNRWPWPEQGPWTDGHAPVPRPVLVILAVTGLLGVGLTAAVSSRQAGGLRLAVRKHNRRRF